MPLIRNPVLSLAQSAQGVVTRAVDDATKALLAPPVVWGITLQHHPEQYSWTFYCRKLLMKLFLVPLSFVTYVVGSALMLLLYSTLPCYGPCLGRAFISLLCSRAKRRARQAAGADGEAAAAGAKKDLQKVVCLGRCLISFMGFLSFQMVRPFCRFLSW